MTMIEKFHRACERLGSFALFNLIDKQTDLVHYRNVDQFAETKGREELKAGSNAKVWERFVREDIYDTKRVTLEEFHLFEWFPLAPGKFHTAEASQAREDAEQYLEQTLDGKTYYNPMGKGLMIQGGVGNVRLLPRTINGEEHYFMTASSTGICHEGFPVLLPRRFYGEIKARIRQDGAAPVTLRGEMRYLPDQLQTLFGSNRDVPLLYLHVDMPPQRTAPRREVMNHEVSIAVSFRGKFQGEEGTYATFATFDPADQKDKERACQWIERFYVTEKYEGVVLTDFDEINPRFPRQDFSLNIRGLFLDRRARLPKAKFALEDLMSGQFDLKEASSVLPEYTLDDRRINIFIGKYEKQIHTEGGAYVEGNVNTGGGKFVGRDDD
jgi:hypothetical protein